MHVRPKGELVWVHATDRPHVKIARKMVDRLAHDRPDIYLLLTTKAEDLPGERMPDSIVCQPLPADNAAAATRFLDHWSPDICVWTAGDIKPAILGQAHRRAIPMLLVDADQARLSAPGWRWLPGATQQALRRFSLILARDAATEQYLRRRIGMRGPQISITEALWEESKPLPYTESDREDLAALLRGRPVWLAAHLHADELPTVLEANAAVQKLSHRALLILAPRDGTDLARVHAALSECGQRYVTWSEGEMPNESTQIILADTPEDLGLWYRVSPISFMGCSLIPGGLGSDPNEPAAHGSAILYGPNIRDHLEIYSRFAEAGAARIVRNADTLANAVQRIIPPDQSAAMAHAAWDVATQSAASLDRLVSHVLRALDRTGAA